MKKITAHTPRVCTDTGKQIAAGETMYHDFRSGNSYSMNSPTAIIASAEDSEEYHRDATYTAGQESVLQPVYC